MKVQEYIDYHLAKNADEIGFDGMLQQTIEECSELIHALCKLNRARGIGQMTDITKERAEVDVIKEMADVRICIDSLEYLMDIDTKPERYFAIKDIARRYGRDEE